LLSIYPEKFHRVFSQETIVAKRTNYQGEKRAKELNRLKKQSEKEERKKNNTNDQSDETLQPDDETPAVTND
jgi:enterochelin esterase-like enzyme